MNPSTVPDSVARQNGYIPQLDGAEWRARMVERPKIEISGDLADVTRAAWSAIEDANDPPFLFTFGTMPVRIEHDDAAGALVTRLLTPDRARYVLARVGQFFDTPKRRDAVPRVVFPPLPVVHDVLATPDPPLPRLVSVVEVPVMTRTGRIRSLAGYDDEAGVFYEPPPEFVQPIVPEHPTPSQISAAVELVASELLGDFQFQSLTERTHAIGLFVLPFVRECIDGPTPLHAVEAPSPGTGKTLLVTVLLAPALGRAPALMAHSQVDEETRKRLLAIVSSGARVAIFDNLRGRLDSSALAAVLTSSVWQDRVLGRTEMTTFPVRTIWVATANNATLSLEIARRTVRIRLDADSERPWLRTGFRHSDLIAWTLSRRPDLIAAALTLARAWIDAGRPSGSKVKGMFEAWSRVIGGILTVAGLDGFLENEDDLYETADRESGELRAFVAAWWAAYGQEQKTAADLNTLDTLPSRVTDGKDTGRTRRLGNLLADLRDRRFTVGLTGLDQPKTSLRVEQAGDQHGVARWRLVQVDHGRV
jgi:hypothetical protein